MSETHSPDILISSGEDYELFGDGDGTSFILRSKADYFTAHLKGEDAARFSADYNTIKTRFPTWKPDQTLAQLWDQGGYSWLAAQDGE